MNKIDGYWSPVSPMEALNSTPMVSTGAGILSTQSPQIEAPKVGDKMLVRTYGWGGGEIVTNPHQLGEGELFEVEVTAIKKAKVVLE